MEEKVQPKTLKQMLSTLEAAFSQRSITYLSISPFVDSDDENYIVFHLPEESNPTGVEKLISMLKDTLEFEKCQWDAEMNNGDGHYTVHFNVYKIREPVVPTQQPGLRGVNIREVDISDMVRGSGFFKRNYRSMRKHISNFFFKISRFFAPKM